MPKEYEYAFTNFDKEKIISKIKKLKGVYKGTFLFRVQQFDIPYNSNLNPNLNIRVRDEGYRITMTVKIPPLEGDNFDDEYEVIIDNFDDGVNYLLSLGYIKQVYYEKIREIWKISNAFLYPFFDQLSYQKCEVFVKSDSEIVFDQLFYKKCGLKIMEIESPTFEELEKITKMLFT